MTSLLSFSNSHFVLFFGLFAGVHADANGVQLPSVVYQCHTLFVTQLYNTTEEIARPVPGAFTSWITLKGKERKDIINSNTVLERAQEHLRLLKQQILIDNPPRLESIRTANIPNLFFNLRNQIANREGLDRWSDSRTSNHARRFSSEAFAYLEVFTKAIESAKNATTVQIYRDALIERFNAVDAAHATSIAQKNEAHAKVSRLTQGEDGKLTHFFTREVRARIKVQVGHIQAASTGEEALRVADNIVGDIRRELAAWKERDSARKAHEARFSVKTPGNSESILDSFLLQVRGHGVSISENLNKASLAAVMEQSPSVKKLIYREAQILRKLKATQGKHSEALRLRVHNDLQVLEKANSSQAEVLIGMRKSLMGIHRNEGLLRLVPESTIKRMNGETRERILNEALSNPILASLIMNIAVEIPRNPPEPSVTPKPPNLDFSNIIRDYKRRFKGKSKYEVNRLVGQMKQDMANEQAQHAKKIGQHVADLKSLYQRQVQYRQIVQANNEIRIRKESAQQSWLAFLSSTHPELFVARKDGTPTASQIQVQLNSVLNRRLNSWSRRGYSRDRLQTSVSQFSRTRSIDRRADNYYTSNYYHQSDSYDWMLFALTGNPMWIFNPTIARVQLIFDLMNNHNHSASQHYVESLRHEHFPQQSLKDIEGIRDQEMLPSVESFSNGQRALNELSPDLKPLDLTAPVEVDRSPIDPNIVIDQSREDGSSAAQRALDDANRIAEEARRALTEAADEASRELAGEQLRLAETEAQRAADEAQAAAEIAAKLAVEEAAAEAEKAAAQAAHEAAKAAAEAERAAQAAAAEAQKAADAAAAEAQRAADAAAAEAQRAADAAAAEAQRAADAAAAQAAVEAAAASTSTYDPGPSYSSE